MMFHALIVIMDQSDTGFQVHWSVWLMIRNKDEKAFLGSSEIALLFKPHIKFQ